MDNKYYAVIDTNVIVSAMLSSNPASNPAKVFHAVLNGRVVPLYNDEILDEYQKVLSRPKFPFKQTDISAIIQLFRKLGIDREVLINSTSVSRYLDPALGKQEPCQIGQFRAIYFPNWRKIFT